MPCTEEFETQNKKQDEWEDAKLALDKAERKVKTRIKASIVACGLGTAVALATGLGGTIAGGTACFGALFALDDAATDYDFAIAEAGLAYKRYKLAQLAAISCLTSCGPPTV